MADPPTTNPSLLLRMQRPDDQDAWRMFVDLYAPLIYGFGRKHGLQDADASDLTQDVLRSVSNAMKNGKYDSSRGSFRGWLMVVTRNALYKQLKRGTRQPSGTGDTEEQVRLQEIPFAVTEEDWNEEYQKRLFEWACDQVRDEFRDKTWDAFWRTAVKGEKVQQVCDDLGMSAGAVYVAKSRVLTRLKEQIEQADPSSAHESI